MSPASTSIRRTIYSKRKIPSRDLSLEAYLKLSSLSATSGRSLFPCRPKIHVPGHVFAHAFPKYTSMLASSPKGIWGLPGDSLGSVMWDAGPKLSVLTWHGSRYPLLLWLDYPRITAASHTASGWRIGYVGWLAPRLKYSWFYPIRPVHRNILHAKKHIICVCMCDPRHLQAITSRLNGNYVPAQNLHKTVPWWWWWRLNHRQTSSWETVLALLCLWDGRKRVLG